MTDSTTPTTSLSNPAFIKLFTGVQRKLYLFVLSQVGNVNDAEEILQNTNVAICSKADQFQIGTNFGAWANRIALYEVLRFRQKKARSKLQFSDQFVSQIAEAAEESLDIWEEKQNALEACLEKLRDKDKQLIQTRYQQEITSQELASRVNRPANAVYQSLSRIRKTLLECIQRTLNEKSRQEQTPHRSV